MKRPPLTRPGPPSGQGYPMVDACMRSLRHSGWLNFRMRCLLVSFACYQLWLDWRRLTPAMARLFLDYEPGIHYPQFQMQVRPALSPILCSSSFAFSSTQDHIAIHPRPWGHVHTAGGHHRHQRQPHLQRRQAGARPRRARLRLHSYLVRHI